MTRVFIIAASSTARSGLENSLGRAPMSRRDSRSRARDSSAQIEVTGSGPDLDALEGRELDGSIDVLLIDASDVNASRLLADIRDTELASDVPIVLLTDQASPAWSTEALREGVRAILPVDVAADQLLAALQAAAAGLIVLHPFEVDSALPAAATGTSARSIQPATEVAEALTPREREVLQMLAAGVGNKEIAARLNISDHTAKFHVASILGKLGASTRTEAVAVGIRRGLILL